MLDQSTRQAILRLREQGHGSRAIARALGISRGAVREVLDAKSVSVPRLDAPASITRPARPSEFEQPPCWIGRLAFPHGQAVPEPSPKQKGTAVRSRRIVR